MFEQRVYWAWLQHAFGAGSQKPISIARRYPDLAEFFEGGARIWIRHDFLTQKDLTALNEFPPSQAEAQIEFCEKLDQRVIAYCDDDYPEKLKQIDAPPAVLYVKGDICQFDNNLTISVVGSRNADKKAIEFTEYLCYELSKEGVIIVSGGALGIDAAAHRGAMRGFTPTACILACSGDYPYLIKNQSLRNNIVEKEGCLISEYPATTPVQRGSFSVRNRIMSGICNGLLVVKAKNKSGTMLTVAHATRQNKDIFAIPGDVSDEYSQGTNLLIQDGATPVLKVEDILDQYANVYQVRKPSLKERLKKGRNNPEILSDNAKMVYNILDSKPMHVSIICANTGLKVSRALSAVTELELLGYVTTYSGQRCSLK